MASTESAPYPAPPDKKLEEASHVPGTRWFARLGRMGMGFSSLAITLLLTFVGLTAVTFAIGRLVPIDPVLAVVGDRASVAVYERTRLELGLDRSVPEQYWVYVQSLARGDFGKSVMTSRPVIDDIVRVFPATLELATLAIVIGVALGIPAGVAAAVRQGRWPDHVLRIVGLIGYSVPIFWLGLLGLLIFYGRLDWVAGPGRLDVYFEDIVPVRTGLLVADALLAGDLDVARNAVAHLVLPAGLLGYVSMAYIARMTRSLLLDQLRQEYVTAARVHGLSESRIVWRHAFANILAPLSAVVALSYGGLLEGAVLTETVFAWPGLGLYITRALFNSDMNAVLGGVFTVGAVFILLNLLSDVLGALTDPRARAR